MLKSLRTILRKNLINKQDLIRKLKKYFSPYANREILLQNEWKHMVMLSGEYGDEDYANQQSRIPAWFLSKRLSQLGFFDRERVLDLGCGYGQWTLVLGELNSEVHGIDQHSNRINTAREMFKKAASQESNCTFKVGSAIDTLYPDEYFDAIFCFGVYMFLDRKSALNEIERILRPGGILYVCTNGPGWWLHLLFRSIFKNPRLARRCIGILISGAYGIPSSNTPRNLRSILSKRNFQDIEVNLEGNIGLPEFPGARAMNTYKQRFLGLPMCSEVRAVKRASTLGNQNGTSTQMSMSLYPSIDALESDHVLIERRVASGARKHLTTPLQIDVLDGFASGIDAKKVRSLARMIESESVGFEDFLKRCHAYVGEKIFHDLWWQPLRSDAQIPSSPVSNLALGYGRCGVKARLLADLLSLRVDSGILVTQHHVTTWLMHENILRVLDCDLYAPGQIPISPEGSMPSIEDYLLQAHWLDSFPNYTHLMDTRNQSISALNRDLEMIFPCMSLASSNGLIRKYRRINLRDSFVTEVSTMSKIEYRSPPVFFEVKGDVLTVLNDDAGSSYQLITSQSGNHRNREDRRVVIDFAESEINLISKDLDSYVSVVRKYDGHGDIWTCVSSWERYGQ